MDRLRDRANDSDPSAAFAASLLQSATLPEPSAEDERRVWSRLPMARRKAQSTTLRTSFAALLLLVGIAGAAFASMQAARRWIDQFRAGGNAAGSHRKQFSKAVDSYLIPNDEIAAAGANGSSWPGSAQRTIPSIGPSIGPSIENSNSGALEPPSRSVRNGHPPQIAGPTRATRFSATQPLSLSPDSVNQKTAALSKTVETPDTGRSLELALIASAQDALRREHDPARATVLLDDYLERFDHGSLVEEALVLAIEAAAAQDDPSAARYARLYLKRFPRGRFRVVAERARERFEERP